MKNLIRWTLALLAVTAIAGLSGAWTAPPQGAQKSDRQAKRPNQVARAQKQASMLKLMPSLKTSLGEAVLLAEKETAGKAFAAGLEVTDGKPSFQVNLFVGEVVTIANVDPETKAVSVLSNEKDAPKKKEGADGTDEKKDD